jgi:chorismate mutase
MDISDWRKKIDEVDRELVALLNRRSEFVLEIAKLKRQLGMPIYEPLREEEIFRNIAGANGGPLELAALRRLFERIIDESRSIQRVPMHAERAEETGLPVDTELNQPEKD